MLEAREKTVISDGSPSMEFLPHIRIRWQPTTLRFLPAAGYCWYDGLNNAGSNGNYWSSTQNPDNSNNAYNLNFNSGNWNWNWNNRNNGHSVRAVCP